MGHIQSLSYIHLWFFVCLFTNVQKYKSCLSSRPLQNQATGWFGLGAIVCQPLVCSITHLDLDPCSSEAGDIAGRTCLPVITWNKIKQGRLLKHSLDAVGDLKMALSQLLSPAILSEVTGEETSTARGPATVAVNSSGLRVGWHEPQNPQGVVPSSPLQQSMSWVTSTGRWLISDYHVFQPRATWWWWCYYLILNPGVRRSPLHSQHPLSSQILNSSCYFLPLGQHEGLRQMLISHSGHFTQMFVSLWRKCFSSQLLQGWFWDQQHQQPLETW